MVHKVVKDTTPAVESEGIKFKYLFLIVLSLQHCYQFYAFHIPLQFPLKFYF